MRIHYISPYADSSLINGYMTTPSARAKVEYIKECLKEEECKLVLFSPIRCKSSKFTICKQKTLTPDSLETQLYPTSVGGNSLFSKVLSYLVVYAQLVWYLLFRVNGEDIVLVYHALPDTKIIKFLKPLLRSRVFLEIEELYNAAYGNIKKIHQEKKLVSDFADGYLLVNTIIGEKCGISKLAVVCEGQYKMLYNQAKVLRDENGMVNMLYAGALQKNADVFLALDTARLLDESFVLHIAGYGEEETIRLIHEEIDEINKVGKGCKVVFHGCLFGEDYESLLKHCSLGLCSRILENELSDYTFPSKVFAYMSRNLRVICTPISCVQNSTIKDSVVFSTNVSPLSFMDAIKRSLKEENISNEGLVEAENQRFKKELKKLLALS